MTLKTLVVCAGVLLCAAPVAAPVHAAASAASSCESLAALKLPHTTITLAQTVGAGSFLPPAGPQGRGAAVYAELPSFCRVAATLAPSADSDIKVEVWLPSSGWNGKLQAVGNGGWAGTISYPALAQAVAAGYATASTDTGHTGNNGSFALGHPEKLTDFGYRAVHEMTVQAKAVIDTYYGAAPKLSFWNGCSLGGRQGITEAQRYPADFDAIVAGAPAVNAMYLHAARVAINQIVHRSPDSYIPPEKYSMIHDAALNACDADDGVKDGVIDSPSRCAFDPKVLACKDADGASCLTPAQVETARALYAPVKDPKSGAIVFPALLEPGSELGWATLAGPQPVGTALDAFKYVVFADADWDWRSFNMSTDLSRGVRKDAGTMNAGDPDLRPFFSRGGKLLIYHGWADQQVAATNSVEFFNKVTKTVGRNAVGKSIELYMVPGMGHCAGGAGTDTFDKMAAIESWVKTGRAPESIVAAHRTNGVADRTRPLCPFGKTARWNGAGNTDDAASFTCVAETKSTATR
ncbi:MAG TPA: tannase/feruloyl esterase family alpha/beta hydrolase [Vicinamibacterales bacterium]|nr:tannase/feruloyl esterase family alpha/beta hydrolase [Vicinamibacterales bacterium]